MIRLLLISVCIGGYLASPVQWPAIPSFFDGFIIGGQNVNPAGKYPWQGTLEYLGTHSCGCIYIGENLALTAAHCTEGRAPFTLNVRLGVHHRSDSTQGNPESFSVTEKIEHEGYSGNTPFPNDISILKLSRAPSEDNSFINATILASGDNDFEGSDCVISGWGRTSTTNIMAQVLQEAETDVITNAECQSRMTDIGGIIILDNHICTYDGQATSCNGDSGGPLVCRNDNGEFELAGITSWGIQSGGNCLVNYPAVFTRVAEFIDWIYDNS